MWQRIVICCMLLALCSAAPPAHINRLALFPDKSAWCEAKNITQIVGHTGCQPRSIQNRACLGQCFSYSVPNTFPQSTESLVHCDSCMPAQTQWEVVTLECPGSEDTPRVDKLVERIIHCSCQSCSKEGGQDGAVMQLYPSEGVQDPPLFSHTDTHPHPHTDPHPHPHTDTNPQSHTDTHPHPHTDPHPHPHTDTHPHPHTETHPHPHTDSHLHPHTDTNPHPHTDTHPQHVHTEPHPHTSDGG